MMLHWTVTVIIAATAACGGFVAGEWFAARTFEPIFEKLLNAYGEMGKRFRGDDDDWWRIGPGEETI